MVKLPNKTRKVLIGFAGWTVLLVGLVMVPYPGPGWAVVFIGLTILAREFQWAHDLHVFAHGKYSAWQTWLMRQPTHIKAAFWVLTSATVIITIWLLNGYGLINNWFSLGQDWIESPFFK